MKYSELVAHIIMNVRPLEKMLRWACRKSIPGSRRVAYAYPSALQDQSIRSARIHDYTLQVDVGEWRGMTSYFFGVPHTLWFIDEMVDTGDTCIDIGANMGHYSLRLAHLVGPSGRVIAVEPQPSLCTLITQSAEKNGYGSIVEVNQCVVHDSTGEVLDLHLGTSDNSGLASLYARFYRGDRQGEKRGQGRIQVTSMTLDDVFREAGIDHAHLVKVDVEGAEHAVVEGGIDLLLQRRIDYLLIETVAEGRAYKRLQQSGYAGYFVDAENRSLVDGSHGDTEQVGDYLFVNPDLPDNPLEAFR